MSINKQTENQNKCKICEKAYADEGSAICSYCRQRINVRQAQKHIIKYMGENLNKRFGKK